MHIKTPLLNTGYNPFTEFPNLKIKLKLENLQPSGSFKIRGLGHLISTSHSSNPCKFVVSSSGGNAGLAAAYAGKSLNIPVHVFVPTSTLPHFIGILKENLARVTVVGSCWDEAHVAALEFYNEKSKTYGESSVVLVHPFDHPLIWQGHSTMIDEISQEIDSIDVILVAVGGGGLSIGVLQGLMRNHSKAKVVLVETIGANSYNICTRNNMKLTSLDAITSIATSLGAKTVSPQLLSHIEKYGQQNVSSLVVSDQMAVEALEIFAKKYRMLVEPSCAAVLSLLFTSSGQSILEQEVLQTMEKAKHINLVAVVCGGSGVTMDMIPAWKEKIKN